MPVTRLNHAVVYVRDAAVSADFYQRVLGFERVDMTPVGFAGAVFLRAPGSDNEHDLGLFEVGSGVGPSSAGRHTVGLYHLAWEVRTLADLESLQKNLADDHALVGLSDHGTTKSLYGKDPDGLEFEIAWLVPYDQLDESLLRARKTIRPLDLEAEKHRYGADTPGGNAGTKTHVRD